MNGPTNGWRIADFIDAYRSGRSIRHVITDVMDDLASAPAGILIGEPLRDSALLDADRLDADPAAALLPLRGVPFVVKDNIDVAGARTTAGCPGFASLATVDAFVVAQLRAAGAIVVGKSNLDQFATGLVGTRSPYGTPPNALDPALVPGGSSSGSAVAVALGLVPFSLGTDTAGSGRVPAALNGIVGIKPTVGSASIRGIVPAVRRFDCPSIFARDVTDATMIARLIQVLDPLDPFCRESPDAPTFHSPRVVGVVRQWPDGVQVDAQVQAWFDGAVDRLSGLGLETREVDIEPLLAAGAMLYGSAIVAERTTSVGVAIEKSLDGLDPVVAAIVSRGSAFTAVDAYATEYELRRLQSLARVMWNDIDALALPVTPALATLADVATDPIGTNDSLGTFTTFANLLDMAGVVVPIVGRDGPVPAGLQLIGPAWSDTALVHLAAAFESGVRSPAEIGGTIVVVGAHLEGFPLNHQLVDRGAILHSVTETAAQYRLYALAGTSPSKPGLVRVVDGGSSIAVEVWAIADAAFGDFVQQVPSPLCIGSIVLADGSVHKGFLCEPAGLAGATDITEFGGWSAYVASQRLNGS